MQEETQRNEEFMSVPYVVYESAQTRMERINHRVLGALILAIILLFVSNAVWLWAWMQYDYTTTETETKIDVNAKDGVANYIVNDGDINNGQDQSAKENNNPEPNT